MSNVPVAVKNIIWICVGMSVLTYLNEPLMARLFALNPITFITKPWQLVTYMFMHGGFGHLFFNMYTLYIFGSVLERVWGTKKFLLFYFVTGIGAALVHILTPQPKTRPDSPVPSLQGPCDRSLKSEEP